jgi:SAM-dependent methyltransferase
MHNFWPRVIYFFVLIFKTIFHKPLLCPHCKTNHGKIVGTKHLFMKIKHCPECELYFVDPMLDFSFTRFIYSTKLYSEIDLATDLPDSESLSSFLANNFRGTNKDYSQRINLIKRLPVGNRLLEFGSSWGYFLWQAKSAGYKVCGVEISKPRADFGINNLGIDIKLNISQVEDRMFDIIYTSHVLEHLIDPAPVLQSFSKILEQNGFLIIEVPNFDFLNKGKEAFSIIGAVHPLGLSVNFFRKILPQYGFNEISFYNSWSQAQGDCESANTGSIIVFCSR